MPRSTPETKFQVLDAVMPHLPQRSQARFKAISKTIHARAAPVSPPPYARLIEDLNTELQAAMADPSTSHATIFAEHPGTMYGIDLKFKRHDATGKATLMVEMGRFFTRRWGRVVTCQPHRFKAIMYRAIQNRKRISRMGYSTKVVVDEVMSEIAAGYNNVVNRM